MFLLFETILGMHNEWASRLGFRRLSTACFVYICILYYHPYKFNSLSALIALYWRFNQKQQSRYLTYLTSNVDNLFLTSVSPISPIVYDKSHWFCQFLIRSIGTNENEKARENTLPLTSNLEMFMFHFIIMEKMFCVTCLLWWCRYLFETMPSFPCEL